MTATVFLSYRQESDEHSERVRARADRPNQSLAAADISVILDQFQPAGGPDQGWAKWFAEQVRHATRVVMVLTPGYIESMVADDLEPTGGRGAAWEARAVYLELYKSRGITSKYRALAFSEQSSVALPAESVRSLRPRHAAPAAVSTQEDKTPRSGVRNRRYGPTPTESASSPSLAQYHCDPILLSRRLQAPR